LELHGGEQIMANFLFFPLMVEQSIPLSRSHVMHELCALMSLMFANGYHHVKATRTSDCR